MFRALLHFYQMHPERTTLCVQSARWRGFSPHSLYGSLSLTQFSGFGIVRNLLRSHKVQLYQSLPVQIICMQPKQIVSTGSELPKLSTQLEGVSKGMENDKQIFDQYCDQVYTCKGVNDCTVHFVVTKNLDVHRTVSMPVLCKNHVA